jgi:hypothetical protein
MGQMRDWRVVELVLVLSETVVFGIVVGGLAEACDPA